MKVNVDLLKKLRTTTWAGFNLCKQALLINNNNFAKAVAWLRTQGIAKGIKQNQRKAQEGVCQVFIYENNAVLMELNCETDFVAQNGNFLKFFYELGMLIAKSKINSLMAILLLPFQDSTVKEQILQLSGSLGEKIAFGKVFFAKKTNQQSFSFYNHNNNKISSLLVLDSLSKLKSTEDLAMHVVALKPQFISLEDVPEKILCNEREIIVAQVNKNWNTQKPLELKEKIIIGKLQKGLKEICLLEQKFIKNPKQTVGDYLRLNDVKILSMFMLQVGLNN